MASITWAVEADFDHSGTYETDLTGEIEKPGRGITIDRGFDEDGFYRVSKVTIDLSNRTGAYSPGNTASARAGQLRPGVPIRIKATHDGDTYTLWTGYIQGYDVSGVDAHGVPLCTLTCTDLAGYLQQYSPLNVLLDERTTDEAYTAIATAAGLEAADYNFPTGAQTLAKHWVRNQTALAAFADVLQAEMGGWWFIDALGVIQGQPRDARLGVTPDDTWGDGTGIFPRHAAVKTSDRHVISAMAVQGRQFVADEDEQVVLEFSRGDDNPVPDSIAIAGGGKYGPVLVDFASPVETIVTPVSGTDYTGNAAIDGSGADRTSSLSVSITLQGAGAEITITNSHASTVYLTHFQLRGLAHSNEPGPAYTYGLSIPTDKTARGEQAQIPFVDDINVLADYAVANVHTYRYPFQVLTLTFDASTDAKKAALLALELGDLIKYKDTGLGADGTYSDDWYYVDAIRIGIPPDLAGQSFMASVTLVPSYLYRNLDAIAWDTFVRPNASGSLGTSTSGNAWSGDTGMDIASNKAVPNTTAFQLPILADLTSDMAVNLVLDNLAEDVNAIAGVQYRRQNGNNYWRVWCTPATNTVHLQKVVAGVTTTVAQEVYA